MGPDPMTHRSHHRARRWFAQVGLSALILLGACEGPVGPKGDPGDPAPIPDTGVPMDAAPDVTFDSAIDTAVDAAPDTAVDAGEIPIEPDGLVGRVTDTASLPVAGGRVVLVLAADVEALAATDIDVSLPPATAAASTVDEPLEDLLDDAARTYSEATTDADGVYRFTALPDAAVFVVFVPAVADTAHLPGGTFARAAQVRASLVGSRLDMRVSANQSASARYVGSTGCVTCHGRHRTFGTAHSAGLSVPGVRGANQDTSKWPEFDAILGHFGATLNFYDCDGASPGAGRCKISETAPPGPAVISFVADLTLDAAVPPGGAGRYQVTLRNLRNAGVATYDVELSYGGALWRTQLLVNVPGADGRPVRYALPFQYQHRGDDTRSNPEDWVWRDVGSSDWYDHGAGTLRTPATDSSFDAQCAGCHFTGFATEGDATNGFHASAVPNSDGAYDYDRDGRREQINLGCESCHGPGSEHLEAPVRGMAIVSPQLLTPGRALALCGSCHSNPAGTALPLDSEGNMPRPGLRRSELIANHWAGSEVAAGDLHPSGDARAHRLQYTDHIRSKKYRNGDVLVTCSECHDPHGRDDQPHDLQFAIRDNAGCTSCHNDPIFNADLSMHVETETGNSHSGADLQCTLCHMPRTVTAGSGVEALLDESPSSAQPVQYFQGDLATHRYRISGLDRAPEQPATATQDCAFCHVSFLPNPPI